MRVHAYLCALASHLSHSLGPITIQLHRLLTDFEIIQPLAEKSNPLWSVRHVLHCHHQNQIQTYKTSLLTTVLWYLNCEMKYEYRQFKHFRNGPPISVIPITSDAGSHMLHVTNSNNHNDITYINGVKFNRLC